MCFLFFKTIYTKTGPQKAPAGLSPWASQKSKILNMKQRKGQFTWKSLEKAFCFFYATFLNFTPNNPNSINRGTLLKMILTWPLPSTPHGSFLSTFASDYRILTAFTTRHPAPHLFHILTSSLLWNVFRSPPSGLLPHTFIFPHKWTTPFICCMLSLVSSLPFSSSG